MWSIEEWTSPFICLIGFSFISSHLSFSLILSHHFELKKGDRLPMLVSTKILAQTFGNLVIFCTSSLDEEEKFFNNLDQIKWRVQAFENLGELQ